MTNKSLVFSWWLWALSLSYYLGFNPYSPLLPLLLAVGVAVYLVSIRFKSDYHWSKQVVIIVLEILFAFLSYVKDPSRSLLHTNDAIFNFIVLLIYLVYVHLNDTDVYTLYFKMFPESHRGETFVEHMKKLIGRP
jgi:hypothetical protein